MDEKEQSRIDELWKDVALFNRPGVARYILGEKLHQLRSIYSERERETGGQSAEVGHGTFERECKAPWILAAYLP